MGRKNKYTFEQKLKAVIDYKEGKRTTIQICNDFGISDNCSSTIMSWVKGYDKYGDTFLLPKLHNHSYSREFKEEVVNAYNKGKGSYNDLSLEYNISHTVLKSWVKKYNSYIELKDYNPQGDVYMTKPRKTTLQERIEIVNYCIENDKQYKLAAKEYDVSYAQAYKWTQKYLEDGEEGLIDKRGKHKSDEEVDELTLLRRENERLKKKLEMKDMETQLLKKVQEVERRRYSPKGNKK